MVCIKLVIILLLVINKKARGALCCSASWWTEGFRVSGGCSITVKSQSVIQWVIWVT